MLVTTAINKCTKRTVYVVTTWSLRSYYIWLKSSSPQTLVASLYISLCMYVCMYVCMFVFMVITYNKSKDQPGKVANSARGQLNGEINISLSPFAPENLVSREGFGSPVPRQPAHLHTQAEYGPCLRDSSRFPRRRPFLSFLTLVQTGRSVTATAYVFPRSMYSNTVTRHNTSANERRGLDQRVALAQMSQARLKGLPPFRRPSACL